jgi:hypothetical protein
MDWTHYILVGFGALLILYMTFKDWMYLREIKSFREWHSKRMFEWEGERQRILDKSFAISEKEKLAIIDLECRQLELRQENIETRKKEYRIMNQNNGGDLDLTEELAEAKRKAIKKLEEQKERDKKILDIL